MASIVTEQLKPQVADLKIKHPVTGDTDFEIPGPETDENGDNIKVKVEGVLYIIGQYSDEYVSASKIMAQELEVFAHTDDKIEALDTINNLKRDMLAKCIVGWKDNGFFSSEYSPAEALDLLTRTENAWLITQLYDFITSKKNFFLTN